MKYKFKKYDFFHRQTTLNNLSILTRYWIHFYTHLQKNSPKIHFSFEVSKTKKNTF